MSADEGFVYVTAAVRQRMVERMKAEGQGPCGAAGRSTGVRSSPLHDDDQSPFPKHP
jgi:hypothetical protein